MSEITPSSTPGQPLKAQTIQNNEQKVGSQPSK